MTKEATRNMTGKLLDSLYTDVVNIYFIVQYLSNITCQEENITTVILLMEKEMILKSYAYNNDHQLYLWIVK